MNNQQDPFQNGMPRVDLSFRPPRWRKMAILSMSLAIASIVFLLMQSMILNLAAAVFAIVLAIISRKKDGKWNGFNIAGLIIGICSLVVSIALISFSVYMVMEALNHPDGEIARLLDKFFLQNYNMSFSEYAARLRGY